MLLLNVECFQIQYGQECLTGMSPLNGYLIKDIPIQLNTVTEEMRRPQYKKALLKQL